MGTQPIRRLLLPFEPRIYPKGVFDQDIDVVELEDVQKRTGILQSMSTRRELKSSKLIFGKADLLTTRLRPNLGKTVSNDQDRRWVGTTEWIPLRVNRRLIDPLILKYFLLSPRYMENAARLVSGKEHPRLSQSDLGALRVPVPNGAVQHRIVAEIAQIEAEVRSASALLKPPSEIIDEAMSAEFGFPLHEMRTMVREKSYTKGLTLFAGSFTLRSSVNYSHPQYDVLTRFFDVTPHVPLSYFVSIPVRLGATAVMGDFVDEGEAFYVHPGATKAQGRIDLDNCYQVSADFYRRSAGAALQAGDLLINRSGEAIGKAALFAEHGVDAVASDFTLRVRFNRKVVPEFAWYFARSVIFQLQVAREARGSSLPNMFPRQVERMLFINAPRSVQEKVVERISSALATEEAHGRAILAGLSRIHRILESMAMSSDGA